MKLPIKIDHRFIYDADGKPIAMIAPTEEADTVIASIVNVVNSHADLVAALEAFADATITPHGSIVGLTRDDFDRANTALDRVAAARR